MALSGFVFMDPFTCLTKGGIVNRIFLIHVIIVLPSWSVVAGCQPEQRKKHGGTLSTAHQPANCLQQQKLKGKERNIPIWCRMASEGGQGISHSCFWRTVRLNLQEL